MIATRRAALKEAVRRLKEAGVDSPVLDARLLVQYALNVDWAPLFTGPDMALTPEESERLESMLARRAGREPVARITGRRAFWTLDLAINEATLDPRADTETLVHAILKLRPARSERLTILDLGTGSGALLLALLKEYPHASGVGLDLAAEAVAIARRNAEEHGLADRATFIVKDWGEGNLGGPFDIVVSNPPYIPASDIPALAPEVKDFDPHLALNGGADGLDAYRALAKLTPALVRPGGLLALEIGQGQEASVKEIFAGSGFGDFELWFDLGAIGRVLTTFRQEH